MTCGHGLCRTDWTCSIDLRNRWNCLRRGLRLKGGPGSAGAATVSAWLRWGCILSPSARTGLADSAPRAKVGQTVGCSTVTRGAKPATRRVADGERMNPRGRVARPRQYRKTTSTRTAGTWRTVSTRGLAAPGTPLSMGSPPLVFYHPAACAARGRIFPAPARGTPHPESDPSRRVSPRCPRTAINSQRSPPAATCEHEASASLEPAGNAREHPRNA
jgi:hypothetical protein